MMTVLTNLQLRSASADDRPNLIRLLQLSGLPTEDLPTDLSGFQLIFEGDRVGGY